MLSLAISLVNSLVAFGTQVSVSLVGAFANVLAYRFDSLLRNTLLFYSFILLYIFLRLVLAS